MSYLPLIDLKNGFWPVVHLLYRISEWNFTDMLNIKGYIFLVRTVTLSFPVHELSALDWSEKWFLTCSSFTIWSIWMKLHRYVDHQRLHIVTKDVISLSISVLLLFRHYISHKITFGAPSSGGVLRSACGAFIKISEDMKNTSGRPSRGASGMKYKELIQVLRFNDNNNRLYLKRVAHLVTKLIFHEALIIYNIRSHHECEGGIDKSVRKNTDWHHEACWFFSCSPLSPSFYFGKP